MITSNWIQVQKYYKRKLYVIVLWAVGYYSFMGICLYSGIDELLVPENSIPVAIGIMIDLYFTYCIYSCYYLGLKGHFVVLPQLGINPNEGFSVRKADSMGELHAFECEGIQEVMAFPQDKSLNESLQLNDITIIKDFTRVSQETNK